jgi:hypothetical protein
LMVTKEGLLSVTMGLERCPQVRFTPTCRKGKGAF